MRNKFVFLFLFSFLVGVLIFVVYGIVRKNPGKSINNIVQTIARPDFSIYNAPSDSVKGTIKSLQGDVFWEPRAATDSAQIYSPISLQQGEGIGTGADGHLEIEFPAQVNIKLENNSRIDFIQTLPTEFVASVASGSAEFIRLGNTPISLDIAHLLVRINSGETDITIDQNKGIVNLNIINGSITTGYNDTGLTSHVNDFNAGQKVMFNDLTRTITF